MKISAIAAGVALGLAGFGGTVYAQQNSQPSSSNNGANVTWVGSRTPSAPESPASTRYEARSYLRQAKQDCQSDKSGQSRQQCIKAAQDEYNNMMASARERSSSEAGAESMHPNSHKDS